MPLHRWLPITAFTLLPTIGLAQEPSAVPAPAVPLYLTPQGSLTTTAPTVHAATKLSFPQKLSEASLVRTVDYAKEYNQPGLGYSWHYALEQLLSASIYLYGGGSIPAGAASQPVLHQFQQAMGEIENSARYRQIAVLKSPTDCRFGSITFRCVVYTGFVVSHGAEQKMMLLVTGFRNQFLKVRLDWRQNSPARDELANFFLLDLTSQVLR